MRVEHAAVTGVVPIVEVAAKPRHAIERGKGRLEPFDRFDGAEPAEIARCDDRQQIDADVGRRSAMRDRRSRYLLKIVGGQHVVGRRHDELEEAPGLPCDLSHGAGIVGDDGQPVRSRRRCADPACDRGRRRPQQTEGKRQRPRAAAPVPGDPDTECADQQRARHAAIECCKAKGQVFRQLRRRCPLQQVTAGDRQPHQRPRDRVAHHPCLIGQKDDRQCPARRRQPQFVAERLDLRPHVAACRPAQQAVEDRNQRGCRHDEQQEASPKRRRGQRQDGPAGEQCKDAHRRGQAAA